MSISQLSISYLQEVSTATQEREETVHKEDCIIVLVRLVVEVMAPTVTNIPCLCGHHLQRVSLAKYAGEELFVGGAFFQGFNGAAHSQGTPQKFIFCEGVQETIGRNGDFGSKLPAHTLKMTFES